MLRQHRRIILDQPGRHDHVRATCGLDQRVLDSADDLATLLRQRRQIPTRVPRRQQPLPSGDCRNSRASTPAPTASSPARCTNPTRSDGTARVTSCPRPRSSTPRPPWAAHPPGCPHTSLRSACAVQSHLFDRVNSTSGQDHEGAELGALHLLVAHNDLRRIATPHTRHHAPSSTVTRNYSLHTSAERAILTTNTHLGRLSISYCSHSRIPLHKEPDQVHSNQAVPQQPQLASGTSTYSKSFMLDIATCSHLQAFEQHSTSNQRPHAESESIP